MFLYKYNYIARSLVYLIKNELEKISIRANI